MLGMTLPDVDRWSERVVVALGQNPSAFTGPGTNVYLIGTGRRRLLLDPGGGEPTFLPVLERAMRRSGCEEIQEIVLTHGHPDHVGGVRQVLERFGEMPVHKMPWPEVDAKLDLPLRALAEGQTLTTEGARLRALHTPGHAPDHLCFLLDEEGALFSGDNVLGVGTTVIPLGSGDLGQYMASLEKMRAASPGRIYPAHGPCIEDGVGKLQEYIEHRKQREVEILRVLEKGPAQILEIVRVIYAAYPAHLHAAAAQSVAHHLLKLEREGRAQREAARPPLEAVWKRP